MTTSTRPAVLVLLSAVSAFGANVVQLVLYFASGLFLFSASLGQINILGCVVVFALSLVLAVSLGILAAALQVAVQKGSLLVWVLGSGAWFMTGTLFPIASLPRPLQLFAHMIPITHALDGMRLALLQNASFQALAEPVGILFLFSCVLLPSSLIIFSRTLRRARLEGTLSFY